MTPRKKKIILFGTKVIIAAVALAWLIQNNKLNPQVLATLCPSWWLFPLIVVLFLGLVLQAIRWWCLLRLNSLTIPLKHVLIYSWIGQFFQLITPGTLGAEVTRFYYITKEVSNAKARTLTSVFFDRVLAIAAFFILALIPLWFQSSAIVTQRYRFFQMLMCVTVLCFTVILVVWMIYQKIKLPNRTRHSKDFKHYLDMSNRQNRLSIYWFISAFALSIGAAFLVALSFWIAAQAMRLPLSLSMATTHIPLVMAANGLPIAPGGLGVGESVAVVTFAKSGYTWGADLMLAVRVCLVAVRIPGVILFVFLGKIIKGIIVRP